MEFVLRGRCAHSFHSCPSTMNCPWHADFVVYTNVQPSVLATTSQIEHSCASCWLPGWSFQQNVCCPSSKVDCVVSCGEMQRVLLAAELEHCLGYPRGHTASLMMPGEQVDLTHVEMQRVAMLQCAASVLQLVTVLLSHFHVQDSKRASQLQACANPNWMVHSMCERVEKMRAEVPYLQDRTSHKLSVTGTMGPEENEKNFNTTAACSDLVQPRSCTQAAGHTSLLPRGLHLLRTPCVRVLFLLQLQLLHNCQMTWILQCDSQRVSVPVFRCTVSKNGGVCAFGNSSAL